MEKLTPKYKRIILKLSGEALAGDKGFGLDEKIIAGVVDQLVRAHEMGVEIGIVLGGGNFWRGRQGTSMDRTTADHMGMLATVINSLAMQDAIEQRGVPVRVQTALNMISVAEPFILRKALRHFELGRIVIFACGTGNPYCSTDTGAALRACETNADILLLAKNVDGIYDSDPKTNPNAKKIDKITHMEVTTTYPCSPLPCPKRTRSFARSAEKRRVPSSPTSSRHALFTKISLRCDFP